MAGIETRPKEAAPMTPAVRQETLTRAKRQVQMSITDINILPLTRPLTVCTFPYSGEVPLLKRAAKHDIRVPLSFQATV